MGKMFKKQKTYLLALLAVMAIILIPSASPYAEIVQEYKTGFYAMNGDENIFIDIYTFLNYKEQSLSLINKVGLGNVIFVKQDDTGATLKDINDQNEPFKPVNDMEMPKEYTELNKDGIELTIENNLIVNSVDNDKKNIWTTDEVFIEDLLGAIRSNDSKDTLSIVNPENNKIEGGGLKINSLMKLEIDRRGYKVYYGIYARPVLGTNNIDVIKEIKNNTLYVHPGKTVGEVIGQITTNHEGYIITIEDKDMNPVANDKLIEEGMKLNVQVGSSGYGFGISIYVENVEAFEVELTSKNNGIVLWIDNDENGIRVYDIATVGGVLGAIKSSNEEDNFNIVDANGNIIDDKTTQIHESMKLQVIRGDDKIYRAIWTYIVIDTKDENVIKEVPRVGTQSLIVYPGKTVGQVIAAVKANRDDYILAINNNGKKMNDNDIVVDGMELRVQGWSFPISIYYELLLSDYNIGSVDNSQRSLYTTDNITIGQIKSKITLNATDYILNVVDLDKNIISDETRMVNSTMYLEIEIGGTKIYWEILASAQLDTKDETVIKKFRDNVLYVLPGKTVNEVIAAIKTNHEGYDINIIGNDNKVIDGASIVDESMMLKIDTGRLTNLKKIYIYVDDFEVDLINKNDNIISYLSNERRDILTNDNIAIQSFLDSIESKTQGDKLNIVDSNKEIITDITRKINSTMKLEITRDDIKVYYEIKAWAVLSFDDDTVIKEIIDGTIYVYPGKTVDEIINSVKTNHNIYKLSMRDKDNNSITENTIVEEGSKMQVDLIGKGYNTGFNISIYIGG